MTKRKIILIHLSLFLILTLIFISISEYLLIQFMPGMHNVNIWLTMIIFGTIGIFILSIISCIIFIRKL